VPREGRFAIVTSVGAGCDGRCSACDERGLWRTAKACGPGTPGLVLSAQGAIIARDGDYQVTDIGESTQISVNTIAQGMSWFAAHL
jgi:hypothetical protein